MQEQFEQLLDKRNGYLLTSDVVETGISKPALAEYVRKNHLERVAHGVYLSPAAWPDDYFLLYVCNKKIIFSHESALFLHGMTDREPSVISVTVNEGYNATHLRQKGVRVFQVRPAWYGVGLTMTETNFHHEVAVYDRERTICDMIRCHDSMDSQVFQTALKQYMGSPDRDLNRLLKCAGILGVEKTVKIYIEMLV